VSTTNEQVHENVRSSAEFAELRSRLRRFVFPMSAVFLLWYLAFVLLAAYAPELMAVPVVGAINVGLLLGLAQFVSTFAIATAYVRYANTYLDPVAERLRARIEGDR
jgi:uncharacterized membrane protein (DUF485 family)